MGLKINEAKTEFMPWINRQQTKRKNLIINLDGNELKFEEVGRFGFLKTVFMTKPEMKEEILSRLILGNR